MINCNYFITVISVLVGMIYFHVLLHKVLQASMYILAPWYHMMVSLVKFDIGMSKSRFVAIPGFACSDKVLSK